MTLKMFNHKKLIPNVFQPVVSSRTRVHDHEFFKKHANSGLQSKFFFNWVVSLRDLLNQDTKFYASIE